MSNFNVYESDASFKHYVVISHFLSLLSKKKYDTSIEKVKQSVCQMLPSSLETVKMLLIFVVFWSSHVLLQPRNFWHSVPKLSLSN